MNKFKPGDKVRRVDIEDTVYAIRGEIATLINLNDDLPSWHVLRASGEKTIWDEERFELVEPVKLEPGDHVRHETLGRGNIIEVEDAIDLVAGTAVVQFSNDNKPGHVIAINLLTKMEPELPNDQDDLVQGVIEAARKIHHSRAYLGDAKVNGVPAAEIEASLYWNLKAAVGCLDGEPSDFIAAAESLSENRTES